MEKDLKIILDEEEAERRDELKAQGLWEDIYYILKVEVVRAIDIKKADTFGKSDAYCTIVVNDETVDRTDTIMKSLDPEWNQIFKVRITEEDYEKEEFGRLDALYDAFTSHFQTTRSEVEEELSNWNLDLLAYYNYFN